MSSANSRAQCVRFVDLGDAYVESKVHAELVLEKLQASAKYRLDIVRLGNIVGEGSPAWTANLAQRLLDGRAVGVAGSDGYSNAAFAPQRRLLPRHLVAAGGNSSADQFGRYHHFADLSGLRWSTFFIERFAEAAGVLPTYATALPGQPVKSFRPHHRRDSKSRL